PPIRGSATTRVRTASSICRSMSSCVVLGARSIVTAEAETSMSLTIPNDTMSREKPGYGTSFRRSRISCGVGTRAALTSRPGEQQGAVTDWTDRPPDDALRRLPSRLSFTFHRLVLWHLGCFQPYPALWTHIATQS